MRARLLQTIRTLKALKKNRHAQWQINQHEHMATAVLRLSKIKRSDILNDMLVQEFAMHDFVAGLKYIHALDYHFITAIFRDGKGKLRRAVDFAIETNSQDAIAYLLPFDETTAITQPRNPLQIAVIHNAIDDIKRLLPITQANPDDVFDPLSTAARLGRLEIVKLFCTPTEIVKFNLLDSLKGSLLCEHSDIAMFLVAKIIEANRYDDLYNMLEFTASVINISPHFFAIYVPFVANNANLPHDVKIRLLDVVLVPLLSCNYEHDQPQFSRLIDYYLAIPELKKKVNAQVTRAIIEAGRFRGHVTSESELRNLIETPSLAAKNQFPAILLPDFLCKAITWNSNYALRYFSESLDPAYRDKEGNNIAHVAVKSGVSLFAARLYMQHRALFNIPNQSGVLPLQLNPLYPPHAVDDVQWDYYYRIMSSVEDVFVLHEVDTKWGKMPRVNESILIAIESMLSEFNQDSCAIKQEVKSALFKNLGLYFVTTLQTVWDMQNSKKQAILSLLQDFYLYGHRNNYFHPHHQLSLTGLAFYFGDSEMALQFINHLLIAAINNKVGSKTRILQLCQLIAMTASVSKAQRHDYVFDESCREMDEARLLNAMYIPFVVDQSSIHDATESDFNTFRNRLKDDFKFKKLSLTSIQDAADIKMLLTVTRILIEWSKQYFNYNAIYRGAMSEKAILELEFLFIDKIESYIAALKIKDSQQVSKDDSSHLSYIKERQTEIKTRLAVIDATKSANVQLKSAFTASRVEMNLSHTMTQDILLQPRCFIEKSSDYIAQRSSLALDLDKMSPERVRALALYRQLAFAYANVANYYHVMGCLVESKQFQTLSEEYRCAVPHQDFIHTYAKLLDQLQVWIKQRIQELLAAKRILLASMSEQKKLLQAACYQHKKLFTDPRPLIEEHGLFFAKDQRLDTLSVNITAIKHSHAEIESQYRKCEKALSCLGGGNSVAEQSLFTRQKKQAAVVSEASPELGVKLH